jgi:hypothetical protein
MPETVIDTADVLASTLVKDAGQPKELHEAELAPAELVFDVEAYVDDFNRSVVTSYRRGVADVELPADAGVARSIVPPGRTPCATSAAWRPHPDSLREFASAA